MGNEKTSEKQHFLFWELVRKIQIIWQVIIEHDRLMI